MAHLRQRREQKVFTLRTVMLTHSETDKWSLYLRFSHLMWDPLGPALGLILSAADLLPGQVTVLHQGPPAHLSRHVLGKVHHLDVTDLAEDLVTFLLLQ